MASQTAPRGQGYRTTVHHVTAPVNAGKSSMAFVTNMPTAAEVQRGKVTYLSQQNVNTLSRWLSHLENIMNVASKSEYVRKGYHFCKLFCKDYDFESLFTEWNSLNNLRCLVSWIGTLDKIMSDIKTRGINKSLLEKDNYVEIALMKDYVKGWNDSNISASKLEQILRELTDEHLQDPAGVAQEPLRNETKNLQDTICRKEEEIYKLNKNIESLQQIISGKQEEIDQLKQEKTVAASHDYRQSSNASMREKSDATNRSRPALDQHSKDFVPYHEYLEADKQLKMMEREVQRLKAENETLAQQSINPRILREKSGTGKKSRPKTAFGHTKDQEDYVPYREHLEAVKQLNKMEQELQRLDADNEKLRESLSVHMDSQLSRDESSLENINVKNRPLKIKAEFENFCGEQWLAAKQAVDQYVSYLHDDRRHEILVNIMMDAYNRAKEVQTVQRQNFINILNNPELSLLGVRMDTMSSHKQELAAKMLSQTGSDTGILTADLEAALSKYLRIQCDATRFNLIAEDLLARNIEHYELQRSERMKEFCQAVCVLSWKMVVQTPPMTFDASDLGNKFDEKKHEPAWGSKDAKKHNVKIVYYVQPALYHDKNVVVKARVMLA